MRKEDVRETLTSPHSLLPLLREPPAPHAPRAASVTGHRRRRPVSAVASWRTSRLSAAMRAAPAGRTRVYHELGAPACALLIRTRRVYRGRHHLLMATMARSPVSGSVVGPLAGMCVRSIARTAIKGLHLGAFVQALRP